MGRINGFDIRIRFLSVLLFCIFNCQSAWAGKADGLNEAIMGENLTGGFGDFHIDSKDWFTPENREVIWFASFKGFGAYQANLSAEWITPAGKVFKRERFTTQWGNSRFGWTKLDIRGSDKQALLSEGQWIVKVYWDDELIDRRTFYLGTRKFVRIAVA